MKINIELDIPDGPASECLANELDSLDKLGLPNRERAPFHLRLLLLDALSEFRDHRVPAWEYVCKRYPATGDGWRKSKIEKVKTRNSIASTLHTALSIEGIKISEVPS